MSVEEEMMREEMVNSNVTHSRGSDSDSALVSSSMFLSSVSV